MDRLYQNFVIFLQVFSCNNPNGICNSKSKTCQILIVLLSITMISGSAVLVYFLVIALGFFASYILNHQSYNILTGCPLDQPNCKRSELFCHGGNNGNIYGGCLASGLLSGLVLFFCIPIIYYIVVGIKTIINDIYESFKNTKESIVINHDVKLDDVKLDDVKLDDVKLDD